MSVCSIGSSLMIFFPSVRITGASAGLRVGVFWILLSFETWLGLVEPDFVLLLLDVDVDDVDCELSPLQQKYLNLLLSRHFLVHLSAKSTFPVVR